MHRPIFAVQQTEISTLYRLTSILDKVLDDTTLSTDFYNYDVMFSRYHALVINPGLCTDVRLTSDFDHLKAVLLNLRRMEVEKCLDLDYRGCGDARYKAANAE